MASIYKYSINEQRLIKTKGGEILPKSDEIIKHLNLDKGDSSW